MNQFEGAEAVQQGRAVPLKEAVSFALENNHSIEG